MTKEDRPIFGWPRTIKRSWPIGLLGELAGTLQGKGFNLIARPGVEGNSNFYLQLDQTCEVLKVDPIGSSIPNRRFGQNDIELSGLTYPQNIQDASTEAVLHMEPGIWITQPATINPPKMAPARAQIVARMVSIPQGNALLAQGAAQSSTGPPTLKIPTAEYAFSKFPSFNSTPFPTLPTVPAPVINGRHWTGTIQ